MVSPMEAKKTNDRTSAYQIRSGKILKNRIVVPPMASSTADAQGAVTEATVSHYRRLTESGAGLIFIEYSYVLASGKSEPQQLGIDDDRRVGGLKNLAATIREGGALAGIQLTHAGGKTERALTGGALMGPGSIAVPVKDRVLEQPDPMSEADIERWKDAFIAAAARAASAGFDVVELHAAHGYGLNQWLSPITNQRTDRYGGTLENRARLLLEIVEGIRHAHPGLTLSVRMPGQDFLEGGLTINEAIRLARWLEAAGVDILDVSSGIGGWRRPRDRSGEGYLVSEAEVIQAAVRSPVIGVGGIETGEFIDRAISGGRLSLAAVGRAILKDPGGWRKANLATA
jgi:NADPH2 dehydrogenase